MGQRSQIYVSHEDKDSRYLTARYFSWNYGSRMVSRVKGLVEWLSEHGEYVSVEREKIARVADVNFDLRDVVISTDCIEESIKQGFNPCTSQPNNDGKAFIRMDKDGTVKYAFTDRHITRVFTAEEYMAWGGYETEQEEGSNYSENVKFLSRFQLMTYEEIEEFVRAKYTNYKGE